MTTMTRCPSIVTPLMLAMLTIFGLHGAARQAPVPKGTLERLTVHGRALEGNLEGDSPDRPVVVYLPPSYATAPQRRYPVLYFLHGYAATADAYARLLAFPDSIDRAIAVGARETIVVIPDAFTKYGGSAYSNSPTIGDWETFIARDLTIYMDERYRTIASREGRGLAGHSMGGYGTLRIGMKRPDVFAALYAMSSCCLMNDPVAAARAAEAGAPRGNDSPAQGRASETGRAAASQTAAEPGRGAAAGGAVTNTMQAQAAAWSPNPHNPPGFVDLPTKDGETQPLVAARWVANSPLVMVDQYVPALKSMKAVALDVGDEDGLAPANRQLDAALTRLDVLHVFEVYSGNHGNRVAERFESRVLPFFSKLLAAPTR